MVCMMWPQQTKSLSSQNKINAVAHAITHKRSRDLEAWSRGWFLQQENRNELKNRRYIASSENKSQYRSKIDKNYTLW